MTAPPHGSPLAALISGEPIDQLEGKRNHLRGLVTDLEAAITEAEQREARLKARRDRRINSVGKKAN